MQVPGTYRNGMILHYSSSGYLSSPGLTGEVISDGRVILSTGWGSEGFFSSSRAWPPNPVMKWVIVLIEPEADLSNSGCSN